MKRMAAAWMLALAAGAAQGQTLAEQNEALFKDLKEAHGLTDDQLAKVKSIFAASGFMGQGNPAVTKHPMTTEECKQRRAAKSVGDGNALFEKICGAKHMAPLYDPKTEKPEDAKVCIDQFEFPSIPCLYPVTWVRANEAAEICSAMGRRMCDAHEWEGACAGALEAPDYDFASL